MAQVIFWWFRFEFRTMLPLDPHQRSTKDVPPNSGCSHIDTPPPTTVAYLSNECNESEMSKTVKMCFYQHNSMKTLNKCSPKIIFSFRFILGARNEEVHSRVRQLIRSWVRQIYYVSTAPTPNPMKLFRSINSATSTRSNNSSGCRIGILWSDGLSKQWTDCGHWPFATEKTFLRSRQCGKCPTQLFAFRLVCPKSSVSVVRAACLYFMFVFIYLLMFLRFFYFLLHMGDEQSCTVARVVSSSHFFF